MGAQEPPESRFVADGEARLKRTAAYREAVAEMEREVDALFEERLREARGLRRLMLHLTRLREIRRRVRNLTPPEALYLSNVR